MSEHCQVSCNPGIAMAVGDNLLFSYTRVKVLHNRTKECSILQVHISRNTQASQGYNTMTILVLVVMKVKYLHIV